MSLHLERTHWVPHVKQNPHQSTPRIRRKSWKISERKLTSHEGRQKKMASDFSIAALWPRRQWVIAAKSESQESLSKLLIKCEGGVAHFCMYRLSKHFPNRIFLRMLVEKALHQNKGENQHRTLNSASRDPTQRHQRGPQDPRPMDIAQRAASPHQSRCPGWCQQGRKLSPQYRYLYTLQGQPPSAQVWGWIVSEH